MENDELHVLIVEDNEADYELMLHALRRGGFSTNALRAAAKEAVVEALRSFDADVVLVDHTLPGSSGLEILHLVQQERPLLPVLVVTGSIGEETAADYIKAGAADYVIKDRLHRLAPAVLRALTLKDALQEVMDAEAAREASEARFRSLVEHSTDVITLLDADGRIVYSTQSLQPTLGYAAGEMTGRSVFDLLQPEQRGTAEALLGNVLRHPEQVVRADLRVRHKEGAWRDLEVVVANRLSDLSLRALVVNYRDVTERKRAEENLRAADERLRSAQKMEAVGRLAAGIAHDFNNLLTAIIGSTDLLLEALPPEHPAREEALESRKAALRAADLTHQLLAFSRQQVLAPRTLDLNRVVQDVERLLRRLISEDIEMRTVLARELAPVSADPSQLEQVLVNLAVNARDAMPHGGTLTIETANVTLDEEYARLHAPVTPGEYVMLAVSDTGVGMDAETQSHIFEPFFTTKGLKGTGLGLSTVYGIIKQSGGYIWVYSEPGKGTSFKIYLPRMSATGEAIAPEPSVTSTKPEQALETILLVEDESSLRHLARQYLENQGYTVLEAADGAAAIEISNAHPGLIHLLLTDVIMPGMNGRELARRVSAVRPETEVLYISGYTENAIAHNGMLEEGIALLQKPFSLSTLRTNVREKLTSASRAQRFNLQLPLKYRLLGESAWRNGTTENISRSGMLFRAEETIQPNAQLEINLVLPAEIAGLSTAEVICHGEVVRTVELEQPIVGPALAARILRYQFPHGSQQRPG